MRYFLQFVLYLLFFATPALAQTNQDSVLPAPAVQKPVIAPRPDAVRKPDSITQKDTTNQAISPVQLRPHLSYADILKQNAWYNFFATPIARIEEPHVAIDKDALFYLLAGLLFFFALIRAVFPKYYRNLMSLVFRASLKQKQIREQLIQTPLPSLLLNIFFVIVAGLYILFLLQYHGFAANINFWLLLLYCMGAVSVVYVVKYVALKFTGWVFNMREAADTYIFIVFLVNKLLGIFMLPVLILMTFSLPSWYMSLLTISYVLVFSFFAYRYIVSFAPVRREVKVSPFHFFMYLCAFEIVPLLLIYKVLLRLF